MLERLRRIPGYWFTYRMPVGRFEYAVSGFSLTLLKLALDSAVYRIGTGKTFPWGTYLSPQLSGFLDGLSGAAPATGWVLAGLVLPFLWIGTSMTMRRCLDAGLSPHLSLLFFVPVVNWLFMLALCFAGSKEQPHDPWRTGRRHAAPVSRSMVRLWFLAGGSGAAVGLLMVGVSIGVFGEYGAALFAGAPFAMAAVTAYLFNREEHRSFLLTFLVTQFMLIAAGLMILLFALEGLICLVMAYPIGAGLSLMGAALGYALAALGRSGARALGGFAIGLPLLLVADATAPPPPTRVVLTSMEIDAPAETVWTHVVDFPPLPPPEDWVFAAGIAAPLSASIEGRGVGAVRRCEFSTGAFVEPITVWEPPHRLAFDVLEQPRSMDELTPYARVFAPHLVDGLVAERGEFLLVELPDGRTRIEGRTWYHMNLAPRPYWNLWSDFILHRIHRRVLRHVRALSEGEHHEGG